MLCQNTPFVVWSMKFGIWFRIERRFDLICHCVFNEIYARTDSATRVDGLLLVVDLAETAEGLLRSKSVYERRATVELMRQTYMAMTRCRPTSRVLRLLIRRVEYFAYRRFSVWLDG